MYLKELNLVNFKNLEAESFVFSNEINCFVGMNGKGKTNVLDAIYYLSFTKSYFNSIDGQNIKHGQTFTIIEGEFMKDDRYEKIFCGLQKGKKKVIKRNNKIYKKLQDHIGEFPLVIISPSDRNLITEGSEVRRKFLDGVISQFDPTYLSDLLRYNKQLIQRNALLKYFNVNNTWDEKSLLVYDELLSNLGQSIHSKRKDFLENLLPTFIERYNSISENNENISLEYESMLDIKPMMELLMESRAKDKAVQYTSLGIHKDDLIFNIEGYPIKKFGSQGQQKTFLIALKLAQFQFLKIHKKTTPILLLDDIFDKLDEKRVEQIVRLVNNKYFGQIFITDTHADRTENIVKKINNNYKMFKLN
ncbi:MAG: DNA replication and repair protein RecF [Ichthyobacteriaceae bacterium]|nr:DNA replication and repair protein RecF [Ichthyobacteriaceae bacterium]